MRVDHLILGAHHVHPGDAQLAWDVGFLVFGAALVGVGWGMVRSARAEISGGASRPAIA